MKLSLRLFALALAFAASAFAAVNQPNAPYSTTERAQGYADRIILAKPRAAHRASVDSAEARERVRVRERFARFGDLRVIELDPGDTVEAAIARLSATGRYEFVERDQLMQQDATPNDPSFAAQWGFNNTGQLSGSTVGADIKAVSAWDFIHDAPGVIVAVVDGGVRTDHVDIAPNLWVNPAPTFGDVNGASIIRGVRSGAINDEGGHGTHVAGIIGATGNNGTAITGVAWRVQLMPLKNSGADGSSASSDSAALIDYAVAHGANVINCSFGGTSFSQTLFTAIRAARDAGVIVVCSAGNSGVNNDTSPHYPSNYLLDNVVSVGNSGPTDAASSSSDYGAAVDLFAPGTSILSLNYASTTGTLTLSGTSMAAPMVTGAVALVKARFPNESYRQIINRLLRGAEPKTSLAARAATTGRLNLLRAVSGTINRPFNDDFQIPSIIVGNTLAIRSNNTGATTEANEPTHVAGVDATGSLWWAWFPTSNGTFVIDTNGSDYDTVLAVYTGVSGAPITGLTRVASNDDSGTGTTSRVSFSGVAGLTYYVAVAGKSGGAGFTQLNVSSAPANDNFAGATPLTGESTQTTGRNNSATLEPNEPRILGFAGGSSLWYKWTAPRNGRFQISAFTTDFDMLLAIYTGSALNNLSLVTANDSTDATATITNTDSRCTIDAVAGTTYYIQTDSKSLTARGTVVVSITDSLWQFSASDDLTGSPAIAPDGTLYFGTISPDRRIYAVNPDGTFKWAFAVGGGIDVATPAVGSDGTVYLGSFDGKFNALTPAGAVRWQRDLGGTAAGVSISPALGADGTIYVHATDGFLYALNPADGSTKWQFTVNALATFASAVVAPDGTIYQGSDDKNFYAINPDGTLKWKFDMGSDTYSTPALDAAGNIYTATYSTSRVISLTPAGTLRWSYNAIVTSSASPSSLSSSPVLSADGATVYIGTGDRRLHAIDTSTGTARWTYTAGDFILAASPAIDSNGVIYVGSYDGKLYAINSSGTLKRTWDTAGAIRSSPVIFDTTLYVGSRDAKLYAFDIGATAAGGPWPMYRHNARRLGRASADSLAVTVAPQSRNAIAGDAVALSVIATGQGPLAFQWLKDGVAIAGATGSSYSLTSAAAASAGDYTVRVTGPQGVVTSTAARLAVNTPVPTNPGRLVNLSILTTLPNAGDSMTIGTVLGGTGTLGTKPLLVRAGGPTLGAAPFNIPGALADPKLELFSGPTAAGSNNDWGGTASLSNAFASVGAFPFAASTSRDAAIFNPALPAGNYTVQVSGIGAATGFVIAELYDATPTGTFTSLTPRLINVSVLKNIGTGEILTAGFVIGGATPKKVLIRAVGPTLGAAPFNVPGTMADPKIELFNSTGKFNENDNWGGGAELSSAFSSVGAFALGTASKDAALVVTLQPGNYTAQVTGVAGSAGTVLVEVYEVP